MKGRFIQKILLRKPVRIWPRLYEAIPADRGFSSAWRGNAETVPAGRGKYLHAEAPTPAERGKFLHFETISRFLYRSKSVLRFMFFRWAPAVNFANIFRKLLRHI